MQDVNLTTMDAVIAEKLTHGGIFLSAGQGDKANVMTIGWGGRSFFWGKELFIAPVRLSRFTYPLIKESGVFTLSVPLHDMKRELSFAGTQSGRDVNKWLGHGLSAQKAQAVDSVIVKECELHLECRVFGETTLSKSGLNNEVYDRFYKDDDMHTLFMGEIVRCYTL